MMLLTFTHSVLLCNLCFQVTQFAAFLITLCSEKSFKHYFFILNFLKKVESIYLEALCLTLAMRLNERKVLTANAYIFCSLLY